MKKLLCVLTIVFAISKISLSQNISINKYINELWGKWENTSYKVKIQGDYIIIYYETDHPSEYIMKIKVNDDTHDRKSRKAHRRPGGWYEFTGTVEYFTYDYNAAYSKFNIKEWPLGSINANGDGIFDKKKLTSHKREARIKIHKGSCTTLNIYFDNIGIGISICPNSYF